LLLLQSQERVSVALASLTVSTGDAVVIPVAAGALRPAVLDLLLLLEEVVVELLLLEVVVVEPKVVVALSVVEKSTVC
jgi:hypothetical protein